MENKDKVLGFRDAAFTVINRANMLVDCDEDGNYNNDSLIYNLGYTAGVLDLVKELEGEFVRKSKEFEEHLDQIKGLQDVIRQIRGNEEDGGDSDIEDYLGGND